MKLQTCEYDDVVLWKSFKKGSEEAFTVLYNRYVGMMFSYGCKINSDEYLVKDCLQDLFFNLWRTRSNLSDTDSVKYYLFCCLRREIIRRSNQQSITCGMMNLASNLRESSIEDLLVDKENHNHRRTLMEKALSRLSPRQQEVIHLRFYEEASFEEIARVMNITPRAVYKLIYRSLGALRKTYVSTVGAVPELLPVALLLYFIRLT